MAGFAYIQCFNEAMEEYKRVIFSDLPYMITTFPSWADSYKSWGLVENQGKVYVAYSRNTPKDQTGMDRKIVEIPHENRGEEMAMKTL